MGPGATALQRIPSFAYTSATSRDSDNTVEGAVPAVGPNGEVYIVWAGPLGLVFKKSTDGGLTFPGADMRVSTVSSNEHDCNGVFPCQGINYGNQQGDYEGLVSFGGVSYPIWTDSRRQLDPSTGCRRPYLMEEVFTAKVK